MGHSAGRILVVVERSFLPPRLKVLTRVLAACGTADGTAIRPSIRRVADLVGRSERRVQAAIAELRALGVLVRVRPRAPGRPTEYRLNVHRLVQWRAPRGGRR